jgi:hypothetical protein
LASLELLLWGVPLEIRECPDAPTCAGVAVVKKR